MADHRDAATGPLGRLALARGTVDRTAELRLDELALAAAWSNPDTRVLVVSEGRAFVVDEPDPVDPNGTRTRLVTLPSYDAPEGDRYFLGRDEVMFVLLAQAKLIRTISRFLSNVNIDTRQLTSQIKVIVEETHKHYSLHVGGNISNSSIAVGDKAQAATAPAK